MKNETQPTYGIHPAEIADRNTQYPLRIPAYQTGPPLTQIYIPGIESYEGETIEKRVERILNNKEPISDGQPTIFTERSQGVIPECNIRTDRWDHALDMASEITNRGIQDRIKRAEERREKEKPKAEPTTEPKKEPAQTPKPIDPTLP